jgi:hypothetical protein
MRQQIFIPQTSVGLIVLSGDDTNKILSILVEFLIRFKNHSQDFIIKTVCFGLIIIIIIAVVSCKSLNAYAIWLQQPEFAHILLRWEQYYSSRCLTP